MNPKNIHSSGSSPGSKSAIKRSRSSSSPNTPSHAFSPASAPSAPSPPPRYTLRASETPKSDVSSPFNSSPAALSPLSPSVPRHVPKNYRRSSISTTRSAQIALSPTTHRTSLSEQHLQLSPRPKSAETEVLRKSASSPHLLVSHHPTPSIRASCGANPSSACTNSGLRLRMRTHYWPRERDYAYAYGYTNIHADGQSHITDETGDDESDAIYTLRTKGAKMRRGASSTAVSSRASDTSSGLGATLRDPFAALGKSLGSLGWRGKTKNAQITTAPGQRGAGETETEADEPPHHLPTTRIAGLPPSTSLTSAAYPYFPIDTDAAPYIITASLLFEASKWLSIVPALIGVILNLWCARYPPGEAAPGRSPPDRADYCVAALWAFLTGYQCLALTTGLFRRWQAYYPPLSTLIRLLALQAICWPATHFTLEVIGGVIIDSNGLTVGPGPSPTLLMRWTTVRPEICWAVIGTFTCFSRSIQIWVTSNLVYVPPSASRRSSAGANPSTAPSTPSASATAGLTPVAPSTSRIQAPRSVGGRLGEWRSTTRKWDWGKVGAKCMLPAGFLYFVMAWVGAMRREWGGC